ncbi:Coiled-coil domain-containing protein [Trema orientale]|uniref:Coiled-coil domain-containing protein n=1 Tax=Trema orientale TaxID=63057 RepID=A0A2P5ELA1_TREOI|nr:Coiled-coil domain-containing protein [Trema orientale]
MEDSQEVLLNSIHNYGVHLPPNVVSVRDLEPANLVSICAQSLNLIDHTASFPTSLPDSVAEQFKICTDIAAGIKSLGYLGDISFHQFLYPSEEDSCKLIRFLVERLSESSKGGRIGDFNNSSDTSEVIKDDFKSEVDLNFQKIEAQLNDLRLMKESAEPLNTKALDDSFRQSGNVNLVLEKIDDRDFDGLSSSSNGEFTEQIVTSLADQSSKTRYEIVNTQGPVKVSSVEVTVNPSELEHLEGELELLKAAADMAFDDQHSVEFYLEQLKEKIEAKRNHLNELNSQWEALKKPLEEEKRNLQDSLYGNSPETKENLQKLKGIELEIQNILSEIKKRKDELSELSKELEKQPKAASRKSYIDRVKEITKNSRKQETDIERILKDTRELQLESNSIQERLHRTYAIVDEIVFREAKKDPVGRQAYRLLTSIHESFEQISEKILAADRLRREVTEREKKLAVMASRSLNVNKLQADLDAIRRENEYLEKCHQDKTNH